MSRRRRERQQAKVSTGKTAPPNTEMFGPMVDGFDVVQWCPTRDGSGEPEAVALVFNVRELGDIVMRLKSRDAVDRTIAALEEHRDAVWPSEAKESTWNLSASVPRGSGEVENGKFTGTYEEALQELWGLLESLGVETSVSPAK